MFSIFFSCNIDTSVPPSQATGKIDEIIVIMDQQDWKGSLGDTVRYYFTQSYDLLPQYEPIFDVRYLKPDAFSGLLTAARNVIIFDVLSNNRTTQLGVKLFGEENIKQGKNVIGKKDQYTKGQQILYVFAKTHQELLEYINENNAGLINKVANNENQKLRNTLYLGGEDKSLSAKISEQLNIDIKVPTGYYIAIENKDMVWLRFDTEKYTANLWIKAFNEKTNDADFGILQRNEFGKTYVKGNVDGSFMTTENLIDYFQSKDQLEGNPVIETRGLWKMTADFLGGPFLNYCITDSLQNRTIVMDAFVMAPSTKKRQIMRQIEYLMNNVKI